MLELEFSVSSTAPIASDHGYHLYAALSRTLPVVHSDGAGGVAIHPICGRQIGNRMMQLMPWSCLRIRTENRQVGDFVLLAGKRLHVAEPLVFVGVPRIRSLVPSTAVRSRLVTIKGFLERDTFAVAVRRHLDALGVSHRVIQTVGRRRTIRIRDKEVVGFEVIVEGLDASESIAIQEMGIGGRRRMGCGVFAKVA